MGLTRLAIRRPLTMLMIILGLVVMGIRSFTELQIDRYPAVDFPFVSVVAVFPGASPEDVEDLVVKPIEDAVGGISGIDQILSTAQEGVGFVIIAFNEGVDGNQAAIDVEREVARVRGSFPDEASEPSIIKADINAIPIIEIVLKGPQGQDQLYQIAEEDIQQRLQAIQGVASVNISGGRERQILVEPNPSKLAAYGLSLESIQQALSLNNLTFPVGSLEQGRQKTSLRSVGEFTGLADIENVVVAGAPSAYGGGGGGGDMQGEDTGGLVFMRDVATVREGYEDRSQILRYNGEDAVSISVVKTSDSNTLEVASEIRSVVEALENDLPTGAEMTIVIDDSEFTRESVLAVEEDLILAILITGIIMLLFLHTIRSTFIVVLAIPTSIISTFLVMWALGFSLNTLTLLALTLTIGILVDDSIVVLENIERHLKMGKKPRQAALDGRAEIGLAAITITLVDVVVYVPVAFSSGIVGQFFRSYGITIATTTLFSLFVSFTLTPMLASLWMRDETQPKEKSRGLMRVFGIILWPIDKAWNAFIRFWEFAFDGLINLYGATLRFVLKNVFTELLAVAVAVVALVAGVYLVVGGFVGAEFFPQEDDNRLSITLEMPPGTSTAATDQAAREIEALILDQVPEAVTILTNVGGGDSFFGTSGSSNVASITVELVDKLERERTTTDVVNDLRPELKKIPEATVSLTLSSAFGGGGEGAISVEVYGPEPDALVDLANQVEAVMRTVPGTTDIINTDAARSPETRLIVDRQRALEYGLSPAQVAGTLRTAVSGSNVGTLKQADATDIDIVLRMAESTRSSVDQLESLPLGYMSGTEVKLGQVADVVRDQAPAVIQRTDRQRQLTITSNVLGRTTGDVTDDIEAALDAEMEFPPAYGYRFSGASEAQRESFAELTSALLLSIILIYMLLVALYQSWLHPLAIMFSLPVALVGAFGGLWLTDNSLNIISLLGIILLVGVVTKNAILLVDFTNVLRREQGYSRKDALVEAGRLRLRPIIMTTAALVFALSPLLLGQGAGAETRAPLAAVVIGGNITSTLLTLVLVPVVYNFFDGGSTVASNFLRRVLGLRKPDDDLAMDHGAAASASTDDGMSPASSPQTGPDAA
jgi:hydrophobic/amphiphilic exporter-1 (mainly G- bacteria), HAE1 family